VNELRKDPTRGQWVLIRPEPPAGDGSECPYCPGAEAASGPEIAAYRKDGSAPNTPGWMVRVVAERDPYFRIEDELVREGVGMFDMITPRGASELIVESPRHDDTLATIDLEQLEDVLWLYRDRLLDLKRDSQIRDILISRRHKKPGVARHHPYSRVTAIPIVFDEKRRELREVREYYQYKRRCLYCDLLRQEITARERVVRLTKSFACIVPYAARGPLETWILPRRHQSLFEDAPRHEYASLARLLGDILRRMNKALDFPPYNLLIHSAPFSEHAADYYHWHVEIIPKLTKVAGFEWATGFYLNPTAPEEAAAVLRDARP